MIALLFVLLTDLVFGNTGLSVEYYTVWSGYRLYKDTNEIGIESSSKITHCAMQCLDHHPCVAAQFNSSSETCLLHAMTMVRPL